MIQAIDNFLGELLKRWPGNKTTESEREKLRAALSLTARVHGERTRPTGESYLDHARAVAAGSMVTFVVVAGACGSSETSADDDDPGNPFGGMGGGRGSDGDVTPWPPATMS